MTTTVDEKTVINAVYHGTLISLFTIGYARLGRAVMGGPPPKLDFVPRDGALLVVDILIKQGILPADLLK